MKLATVKAQSTTYIVPECLPYWLAMERTLPQIEHVFALLADQVSPCHHLEIWAKARVDTRRN